MEHFDQADVEVVSAQSLPALLLQNNMNVDVLRTNRLLREDEWKQLDTRLVTTFNKTINGIDDLRTRGLIHPLGGLQTVLSQYEKVSDMDDAEVSMAAATATMQDRATFTLQTVPVPIIKKGFQFDARHLASSRMLGEPLDLTQATIAARKIAEKLENILFNGNTTVMGGNPIYGYLTHPDRNPVTGADWGTATNIYTNILAMVSALSADRSYGPFVLYVNPVQYMQTLAISDTTRIRSELQVAVDSIPQLDAIKFTDEVPAGEGAMVDMNLDTVDLALAEEPTTVEWETQGGLASHFMTMMVAVPRVKSDSASRCGVAHITGI